ncbi:hypothetical protein chiPu_0004032 [Chiloscyllium punctatum]|uniref:Uncharacterized protein n=1 Tax=Chiloscyllium punctatum TaxID=137246 RepID=A0A401S5D9_CHIPU|nr:hypothetical protein [Chiloscyllium punctatum]
MGVVAGCRARLSELSRCCYCWAKGGHKHTHTHRMRGDDPLAGMRNLKRFSDRATACNFFLLGAADFRDPNDHILSQEDFDEITDFNDLPTSLFACNVHQSVFEEEQAKVCMAIGNMSAVEFEIKCSSVVYIVVISASDDLKTKHSVYYRERK